MAHKHSEHCDVCDRQINTASFQMHYRWRGLRLAITDEVGGGKFKTLALPGGGHMPSDQMISIATNQHDMDENGSGGSAPLRNLVIPGVVCSATCLAYALVNQANLFLADAMVFEHERSDRTKLRYELVAEEQPTIRTPERKVDV